MAMPRECKSRELRAGILYTNCDCVKRNGLQHDCQRTECQGKPECLTKPEPSCCPSRKAMKLIERGNRSSSKKQSGGCAPEPAFSPCPPCAPCGSCEIPCTAPNPCAAPAPFAAGNEVYYSVDPCTPCGPCDPCPPCGPCDPCAPMPCKPKPQNSNSKKSKHKCKWDCICPADCFATPPAQRESGRYANTVVYEKAQPPCTI